MMKRVAVFTVAAYPAGPDAATARKAPMLLLQCNIWLLSSPHFAGYGRPGNRWQFWKLETK
jgi:hypothetical protein